MVFFPRRSKVSRSLLIICINEQDIGFLAGSDASQMRGNGRFSSSAFDSAYSYNH
jgi:hypothetical protein